LARNGPVGPVWRCPLIGVDRKRLVSGQNDAFDPNRTSLRRGTTLRGDFLSTKCAAIEGQSLSYVTRGRSLRSGRLCNDTLQPRDVFQEAPTGQDEEVIAELRVLKVDFK
jgi:hypothetical protein